MFVRVGLLGLLVLASCRTVAADPPAVVEAPDAAPPEGPNCKGFGGMVHGETSCVSLLLPSGTTRPLDVRPMPGAPVFSASCEKTFALGGATFTVICEVTNRAAFDKSGVISLDMRASDAAPPRRIRLAAHEGFWDNLNLWVKPTPTGADIAIDYIVLD